MLRILELQQFAKPFRSLKRGFPLGQACLLGTRLLAHENCRGTCLAADLSGQDHTAIILLQEAMPQAVL